MAISVENRKIFQPSLYLTPLQFGIGVRVKQLKWWVYTGLREKSDDSRLDTIRFCSSLYRSRILRFTNRRDERTVRRTDTGRQYTALTHIASRGKKMAVWKHFSNLLYCNFVLSS